MSEAAAVAENEEDNKEDDGEKEITPTITRSGRIVRLRYCLVKEVGLSNSKRAHWNSVYIRNFIVVDPINNSSQLSPNKKSTKRKEKTVSGKQLIVQTIETNSGLYIYIYIYIYIYVYVYIYMYI